jgi:hypothetical protein
MIILAAVVTAFLGSATLAVALARAAGKADREIEAFLADQRRADAEHLAGESYTGGTAPAAVSWDPAAVAPGLRVIAGGRRSASLSRTRRPRLGITRP